ncbi:hypothetical protein AYI69_g5049 [Smittium culicis]|uniref:Myb-like domain-containing protein n=1 Tax=Smittium culicis TaxID=133412 RepID=A0A1R1Y8I6_9FUNG|nr:hypothetical protein AYI69_g5049 [Smittium culicis]
MDKFFDLSSEAVAWDERTWESLLDELSKASYEAENTTIIPSESHKKSPQKRKKRKIGSSTPSSNLNQKRLIPRTENSVNHSFFNLPFKNIKSSFGSQPEILPKNSSNTNSNSLQRKITPLSIKPNKVKDKTKRIQSEANDVISKKWNLAESKNLLNQIKKFYQQGYNITYDLSSENKKMLSDKDWELISSELTKLGSKKTGAMCSKRWGTIYKHLGKKIMSFIHDDNEKILLSPSSVVNSFSSTNDHSISLPPNETSFLNDTDVFLSQNPQNNITNNPHVFENEFKKSELEFEAKNLVINNPNSNSNNKSLINANSLEKNIPLDILEGFFLSDDRFKSKFYCQLVSDVVEAIENPFSKSGMIVKKAKWQKEIDIENSRGNSSDTKKILKSPSVPSSYPTCEYSSKNSVHENIDNSKNVNISENKHENIIPISQQMYPVSKNPGYISTPHSNAKEIQPTFPDNRASFSNNDLSGFGIHASSDNLKIKKINLAPNMTIEDSNLNDINYYIEFINSLMPQNTDGDKKSNLKPKKGSSNSKVQIPHTINNSVEMDASIYASNFFYKKSKKNKKQNNHNIHISDVYDDIVDDDYVCDNLEDEDKTSDESSSEDLPTDSFVSNNHNEKLLPHITDSTKSVNFIKQKNSYLNYTENHDLYSRGTGGGSNGTLNTFSDGFGLKLEKFSEFNVQPASYIQDPLSMLNLLNNGKKYESNQDTTDCPIKSFFNSLNSGPEMQFSSGLIKNTKAGTDLKQNTLNSSYLIESNPSQMNQTEFSSELQSESYESLNLQDFLNLQSKNGLKGSTKKKESNRNNVQAPICIAEPGRKSSDLIKDNAKNIFNSNFGNIGSKNIDFSNGYNSDCKSNNSYADSDSMEVDAEIESLFQEAILAGEDINLQNQTIPMDNFQYLLDDSQMDMLRKQNQSNLQLVVQAYLIECIQNNPHTDAAIHWKNQLLDIYNTVKISLGKKFNSNDKTRNLSFCYIPGSELLISTVLYLASDIHCTFQLKHNKNNHGDARGLSRIKDSTNSANDLPNLFDFQMMHGSQGESQDFKNSKKLLSDTNSGFNNAPIGMSAIANPSSPFINRSLNSYNQNHMGLSSFLRKNSSYTLENVDFTDSDEMLRSSIVISVTQNKICNCTAQTLPTHPFLLENVLPGVFYSSTDKKKGSISPDSGLEDILNYNIHSACETISAQLVEFVSNVKKSQVVKKKNQGQTPGNSSHLVQNDKKVKDDDISKGADVLSISNLDSFGSEMNEKTILKIIKSSTLPQVMHFILLPIINGLGWDISLYPQIQITKRFKNRLSFLPQEDSLILLSLSLFGVDDTASMSVHLMPSKTPSQIANRIQNLRARRVPANPVKEFCLQRIVPFNLLQEEAIRAGILLYGDGFKDVVYDFLSPWPRLLIRRVCDRLFLPKNETSVEEVI